MGTGATEMLLQKVLSHKPNAALRMLRQKNMQEGTIKTYKRMKKGFETPCKKRDRLSCEAHKRHNRESVGQRIRWLLYNINDGHDEFTAHIKEPPLVTNLKQASPNRRRCAGRTCVPVHASV